MTQVDEPKTAGTGEGPDVFSSKVAFTPEQQTRVQDLIDGAYKKAYSKATANRAGADEMERLREEVVRLGEHKKNAALLKAIARYNVVDAEEVAELMRPHVSDGDGVMEVAGGNGRSMGVDEYVAEWLSERPHHLRNSGGVGSGSQGARFGDGKSSYDLSDPAAWRNMPREELDRLLKEGINVHGSQGHVFSFKDVKNPFVEARKRRFNKG